MGFLSGIGRILAGKPVFTPQEEAANQHEAITQHEVVADSEQNRPTEHAGPKQIPQLHCGRIECHMNNGRCDLYVDVHNKSQQIVFIDDVNIFGVHRELQRQLKPGEAHQELLYSGQLLMHQPNDYALFRYRNQADGDYFQSKFQTRSEKEADGTYRITELRPAGLVKDI